MVHTAPRLHRLVRQCHRTEHDCDKPSSTVHRFRAVSVQILQPTTHAQRYAAMRQTNGLSIVKPTAIFETKGPWVSMVLVRPLLRTVPSSACARRQVLSAYPFVRR